MKANQKRRVIISLVALAVSSTTFSAGARSQTDTVNVPDYYEGGEGTLNAAVTAAINDSTLSNKVFRLRPFGLYILTGTITVPASKHLTIVAPDPGTTQQTAPPQIRWSDTTTSSYHNFRSFGDITLKNLWLLYANTMGQQQFASLQIEDSPDTSNGQRADFDGVIFDYAGIPANGGGTVSVTARHFRGTFRNCYFRNNTDPHFRYYGRAVSFPFASTGWHTDSLTFVNCTFANIGYVYMQENGEYGDVVRFNHCTFLNTVMYTLESGWWRWLSVTNSVFVNAYMYGYFGPEYHLGGTIAIDSVANFGFPVPFTEADRHILFTHSSYVIQGWLRAFMAIDPVCWPGDTLNPQPQPMMNPKTLAFFDAVVGGQKVFPYMNRAYLHDSTDPGFLLPPTDQEAIKRFLHFKWCTSEDTNWAFRPQSSIQRIWPLPENLAYTNDTLLQAGMGGFPMGDLYRWFPNRYAQWKMQEQTENTRISHWLSTGRDTIVAGAKEQPPIAGRYALEQNYPNPFNPTTTIRYTLPSQSINSAQGSLPAGQAGAGVGSLVSLKVYNVLGQEVATLFAGVQQPGNYSVTFDGAGFASGVYLYRLKADNFTQTKRFVLLK